MDPTANPVVQMQDVSRSSDGHVQTVPDPTWDDLRRTVSRLTARSRKNDTEERTKSMRDSPPRPHNADATQHDAYPEDSDADTELGSLNDGEDDFPEGGLRAWSVVALSLIHI